MTDWPQEMQERAAPLLSKSAAYLYNEVLLFLESLTPDFTYTETISRINRRIGELESFAEITGNEYIQKLMGALIEEMAILMLKVDIEKSKIHIYNIIYLLKEETREIIRQPTVIISDKIMR